MSIIESMRAKILKSWLLLWLRPEVLKGNCQMSSVDFRSSLFFVVAMTSVKNLWCKEACIVVQVANSLR